MTKEVADTIIVVDDDWVRRYLSFTELHKVNSDIFSNALDSGPLTKFGLFIDMYSNFRDCTIKKEVYDWCIQNGFRYKKVRYEVSNEFSTDLITERDYSATTGILFTTDADAMAFKLKWL